MKKFLKKILPYRVKDKISNIKGLYFAKFKDFYWSQEGEDIILRRIFEYKEKGFYIDVGAYHPYRFSNTYYFYRRGWYGINIDANPEGIKQFQKFRPRDINLNFAIGLRKGKMRYFMFNEPALNTFDENLAKERDGFQNFKIIKTIELEILTLKEVLDRYMPLGQEIDFMNVDVEGMDYEVLQSNDWNKFRPHILLVEIIPARTIEEVLNSEINVFLKSIDYRLFAKCFNTCIFKAEEFRL